MAISIDGSKPYKTIRLDSLVMDKVYIDGVLVHGASGVPKIVTQPTDVSECYNKDAVVSFSYSDGGHPCTVKWFVDGVEEPLREATHTVERNFKGTPVGEHKVYAEVTNVAGKATTDTVKLDIKSSGAPVFTTQPVGGTTTTGEFELTAIAIACEEPTLEWFINNVPLPDSNRPIFNADHLDLGDNTVWCEATNSIGTTKSDVVIVGYYVAPVFIKHPSGGTISKGDNFTETVTIDNKGVYQTDVSFYIDDKLDGAVTDVNGDISYDYITVSTLDVGEYTIKAIASNSYTSTESNLAKLIVNDECKPPVITRQPEGSTVKVGDTVSASLEVELNSYSINYAWFYKGAQLPNSNSPSISFEASSEGDHPLYCEVSNSCGKTKSDTVTITVLGSLHIVEQPYPQLVDLGGIVNFYCVCSDSSGLTWVIEKSDTPFGPWSTYETGSGKTASTIYTAPNEPIIYYHRSTFTDSSGQTATSDVIIVQVESTGIDIVEKPDQWTYSTEGETTKLDCVAEYSKGLRWEVWSDRGRANRDLSLVDTGTGSTATYDLHTEDIYMAVDSRDDEEVFYQFKFFDILDDSINAVTYGDMAVIIKPHVPIIESVEVSPKELTGGGSITITTVTRKSYPVGTASYYVEAGEYGYDSVVDEEGEHEGTITSLHSIPVSRQNNNHGEVTVYTEIRHASESGYNNEQTITMYRHKPELMFTNVTGVSKSIESEFDKPTVKFTSNDYNFSVSVWFIIDRGGFTKRSDTLDGFRAELSVHGQTKNLGSSDLQTIDGAILSALGLDDPKYAEYEFLMFLADIAGYRPDPDDPSVRPPSDGFYFTEGSTTSVELEFFYVDDKLGHEVSEGVRRVDLNCVYIPDS